MAGLTYIVKADISQFRTAMQNISKSTAKVGKQMQDVGKTMSTYVTAPIVALGAMTVKTAGNFEKSMNKVAALSGATGEELGKLTMLAREMGATTQFSASQAADALGFLAMAGFDTADQMEALPNVLNLAAAASIDLATAADITSNIMSGYGKNASELGGINDALVKTFTSTNTSLEMLGESFTEVGPVASGLGIQFQETSAAIGLLGNAGIQGGKAGTVLKNALVNLVNPSKKQMGVMQKLGLQIDQTTLQNGGLVEVMRQLEASGATTADMMGIFGRIAGPGMVSLVSQGSGALQKLSADIEMSGGLAQTVAEKQMEGFNGSMLKLKSAFEEVQLAIASSGLLDFITKLVEKVTGILGWLGKLNPTILKWGTILAAVAAAIGPLIFAVGSFVSMLPTLTTGVSALAVAFNALNAPITGVILAIAALVAAGIYLYDNWDAVSERLALAWVYIKNAFLDGIMIVIDALTFFHRSIADALGVEILGEGIDWVKGKLSELKDPLPELTTEFGSFGDAISNVMSSVTPAMKEAEVATTEAANTMASELDRIEVSATKAAGAIRNIQPLPEMTTKSVKDFKIAFEETTPVIAEMNNTMASIPETTQLTSDTVQEFGTTAQQTFGSLFNTIGMGFDNQLAKERKMLKMQLKNIDKKVEADVMTTAEAEKAKAELVARSEEKKREIQKKAFKAEKAAAIIQSIIATALGVSQALPVIPLAIAVGALGAAQTAVIASQPTPFASGGLVFGPTMGLVGEGSGTTMSNPEVIAPLDKLKGFLNDAVTGGVTDNVTVSGVIRGEDIYLSNKIGSEAYANLQG